MVTFNNFGNRYEPSVHTGRRNVAARYEARAAAKAAAHIPQGTETTNIKINYGPSNSVAAGQTVGGILNIILGVLGAGKSSDPMPVQSTSVATNSASVSNNSSNVSNTNTINNNSDAVQTNVAPKTSDIDTSNLPSGASISDVTQGTVDGTPSYVATVRNNDGTTSTYSVIKDSNGKYKIGAQLSKQKGNNYVNQEKLNSALEKAFGKGFELPEGYTAELVGDTPVIKDNKGKTVSAAEIKLIQANGDAEKINTAAAQTSDEEDAATMLKDADKDNNKTLSSEEYKNYVYSLLEADGTIQVSDANRSIVDNLISNSFNEIDKINSDGQLSSDELNKYASESFTNLIAKIAEATGQDGSEDMKLSFDNDDLNGDGKIDKSEYDSYIQFAKENNVNTKSFEELDANNDGIISQDELSQQ